MTLINELPFFEPAKKLPIRVVPFEVDGNGIGIRKNPGNWKFFIHESQPVEDRETFFGPLEEIDEFVVVDDSWSMAHIMQKAGIFDSVTQARKNGWNKRIPVGFTEVVAGKLKIEIAILGTKLDD